MNDTLDNLYLEWLHDQVTTLRPKRQNKSYWKLLRQLFTREFVWLIPNDDNRVEDGKELRIEFLDHFGIEGIDPAWMTQGCSVLEMMVALSRHLAFQAEGQAKHWFWHLINNLELQYYTDSEYNDPKTEEIVGATLDNLVWRTYNPNGQGGLFPLKDANKDQTKVEIWYQLNAYLIERD